MPRFREMILGVALLAGTAGGARSQELEQQMPAQAQPSAPETPAQVAPVSGRGGLKVHVITTRSTYSTMAYDVFSVSSRQVVAQGQGADESTGQNVQTLDLSPGIYKIVQHGAPFDSKTDFATTTVTPGATTDFVIVVEPDTYQFRGAGPLAGELPHAHELLGFRIAATVGGSLMLNQKEHVIGATSGVTTVAAIFGNFSLVFDRGNHFLTVVSDQSLGLTGTPTSSLTRNTDRWEASALYAYNINNKYIGPYGRGGFKTQLFPGYLYLKEDQGDTVTVNTRHKDGSTTSQIFGSHANPDDLRIKLAESFAPFVLQEEVGANLRAVSLDLRLLKLDVSTRVGFGFRQGFLNSLKVVDGTDKGTPITLHEVDDYSTLGPVIGANATVTFARWLFGASSFGMMVPVKDASKEVNSSLAELGAAEKLLIDFSGTAGLRLPLFTDFLFGSFDWTFRLERDGFITSRTQFDQTLMARVNLSLF